ncbi:uncharacterized protein LOC132950939 [Metopolophium dirhodum]|uniref:uncharacterized protein LOC132950939 n=1 Tax=Metopolophium dirhodum TaxID=44670 RepID=UPI002990221E|nr:uncharacterized protein LOC132950939 [Metopolophium dirhodum]
MIYQQLTTTVCIFIITCHMVSGPLTEKQKLSLSRHCSRSTQRGGQLPPPPPGFRYMTAANINKNFPRNSFKITSLRNAVSNNNRKSSTPPRGGLKNTVKTVVKKIVRIRNSAGFHTASFRDSLAVNTLNTPMSKCWKLDTTGNLYKLNTIFQIELGIRAIVI